MVAILGALLVGVVLAVHTLAAAVLTRFFRVRMQTRWGSFLYALVVGPLVLLLGTLLFGQVVPADFDVLVVLGLWVVVPMGLGVTIDFLYVPPPEEYDLPDTR